MQAIPLVDLVVFGRQDIVHGFKCALYIKRPSVNNQLFQLSLSILWKASLSHESNEQK